MCVFPQQKLNPTRTGRTSESPPEWFTSYLETVSLFSEAHRSFWAPIMREDVKYGVAVETLA